MQALKWANMTLAFLLELALLGAFAYWGFTAEEDVLVRIVLGIGGPALVILIWAMLLAPTATRRLPMPWRLVLKLVLFGVGALALYTAGETGLAITLAALALVNLVLATLWGNA